MNDPNLETKKAMRKRSHKNSQDTLIGHGIRESAAPVAIPDPALDVTAPRPQEPSLINTLVGSGVKDDAVTVPLRPLEVAAQRLTAWLAEEIAAAKEDLSLVLKEPSSELRDLSIARLSARRDTLQEALRRLGVT